MDATALSPFRLLSADELQLVAGAVDENDKLAFALGCTRFRAAVRRVCPSGTRTRRSAMCTSVARLSWARDMGCTWDERTCMWAARGGHLEVLRWARWSGCVWNATTCEWAAAGGHLEVLRWARENGCEWNARTCAGAAQGGHLEVLRWARENGCEWDARTCAFAAQGGHPEVLRWARENGCPG